MPGVRGVSAEVPGVRNTSPAKVLCVKTSSRCLCRELNKTLTVRKHVKNDVSICATTHHETAYDEEGEYGPGPEKRSDLQFFCRPSAGGTITENGFVVQFHQTVEEVVPVSWFGVSKSMNLPSSGKSCFPYFLFPLKCVQLKHDHEDGAYDTNKKKCEADKECTECARNSSLSFSCLLQGRKNRCVCFLLATGKEPVCNWSSGA